MEWYAVAGMTTMTVLMGLIGFRLAKDELLLRHKRILIGNYYKFIYSSTQLSAAIYLASCSISLFYPNHKQMRSYYVFALSIVSIA
jgi:hypothetical protein